MTRQQRNIAWISGLEDEKAEKKYRRILKPLSVDFFILGQEIPKKEGYDLFVFESHSGYNPHTENLEKLLSSAQSLNNSQTHKVLILSELSLLYSDCMHDNRFYYYTKTKRAHPPQKFKNDLITLIKDVPIWKRKLRIGLRKLKKRLSSI